MDVSMLAAGYRWALMWSVNAPFDVFVHSWAVEVADGIRKEFRPVASRFEHNSDRLEEIRRPLHPTLRDCSRAGNPFRHGIHMLAEKLQLCSCSWN